MSKWWIVVALGLLTHFGASYLVPLEVKDQGAMAGLLRWVWPWGVGDRGLLGTVNPTAMPLLGFFIAMAAAALCAMAVLALLGIWVPLDWWRPLAVGGAALLLIVLAGFFGPTKLLPILVALTVIWLATAGWREFQVS